MKQPQQEMNHLVGLSWSMLRIFHIISGMKDMLNNLNNF